MCEGEGRGVRGEVRELYNGVIAYIVLHGHLYGLRI